MEATGSESPSTLNWSARINRARNDLSRARLRVIEGSLENGQLWVPPSPAHRKTWEEEVNHLFVNYVNTLQNLYKTKELFPPLFFLFLLGSICLSLTFISAQ